MSGSDGVAVAEEGLFALALTRCRAHLMLYVIMRVPVLAVQSMHGAAVARCTVFWSSWLGLGSTSCTERERTRDCRRGLACAMRALRLPWSHEQRLSLSDPCPASSPIARNMFCSKYMRSISLHLKQDPAQQTLMHSRSLEHLRKEALV